MTTIAFVEWLVRSLLFLTAAIPACGYAWLRGGAPERLTALLVMIAITATTVLPTASYRQVVWPLLAVDGALLIGLVAIALFADRFWPLFLAAVQLLAVAVHGVRAYDESILPTVYARLGGELGYMVVGILAVGTWRHWRRGPECDWSWQVRCDHASPALVGSRR